MPTANEDTTTFHQICLIISIVTNCFVCITAGHACLSDPCLHGICIDHLNSSYSCYCEDGFTGYQCQTNWDECWSSPCENGGTCEDGIADFFCRCTPGYTGKLCETEINECLSNPCQNNGICEDFLDRYVCSCPIGYTGVNCEVDVSVCNASDADSKCLNEGVCVDGPGLQFNCLCTPGWTGKICEFDKNECLSEICQNGAVCLNTPGSFACACQYGYTGRRCEHEVIHCDEDPCMNDAFCVMEDGNATCYCFPDFHGNLCQYRYNDCFPHAPRCMNGGECIDGVDSFRCSCPTDIEGVLCECVQTPSETTCATWPPWFMNKPYLSLDDLSGFKIPIPTIVPLPNDTSIIDLLTTDSSEDTEYPLNQTVQESTIEIQVPITPTSETKNDSKLTTSPFPEYTSPSFTKYNQSISLVPDDLFTDVPSVTSKTLNITSDSPTSQIPTKSPDVAFSPIDEMTVNDSFIELQESTTESVPSLISGNETISKTTIHPFDGDFISIALPTRPSATDNVPLPIFVDITTTSPTDKELDLDSSTFSITGIYSTEDRTVTMTSVPGSKLATTPLSPDLVLSNTTLLEEEVVVRNATDISIIKSIPTTSYQMETTPIPGKQTVFTPAVIFVNESTSTEEPYSSTFSSLSTTSSFIQTTNYSDVFTSTTTVMSTSEVTDVSWLISTVTIPSSSSTEQNDSETLDFSDFGTSPTDGTVEDISITHESSSSTTDYSSVLFDTSHDPDIYTSFSTVSNETVFPTSRNILPETESSQIYTSTIASNQVFVKSTDRPSTPKLPILEIGITGVNETSPTATTVVTEYCYKQCMNDGVCILVSDVALCRCPFNYTGDLCATYRYVSQPQFSGSSYLKIKTGDLSLRDGVELYIRFTSESPNGLIAYSEGKNGVFLMLLLRNSLLQFVFSCGLQTVSFLQGNENLSVNSETDVFVRIWWSKYESDLPWDHGRCSARLQVNGESAPVYSEQKASSSQASLSEMYLGGLPSHYNSPLIVKAGYLPRLRGCISMIEVNNEEIDSWLVGIEGENIGECGVASCPENACQNGGTCVPGPGEWSCLCEPQFEGSYCERTRCEKDMCSSGTCLHLSYPRLSESLCLCHNNKQGPLCNTHPTIEENSRFAYAGSLERYASYTSHKINFPHKKSFYMRLHFTTKHLNQISLLAYLGRPTTSSKTDFMALSLVRGHLMLTWNLGSGARRIISPRPLESTWHTHSVRIGRYLKEAWMDVDTLGNVTSSSPGFLSSLETNYQLYLGGHPSWNFSHMPADIYKLSGFQGCIFDVRISSRKSKLWSKPLLLSSFRTGQCGVDPCHQNLCQNGAQCQHVGVTYRCICSPGWKGPYCDTPSHICPGNNSLRCSAQSSCILDTKNKKRFHCLCSYGRGGHLCDQDIEISDPLFSGKKSFLSIHVGKSLRKYASVSLEFKPNKENGILLLATQGTQDGDFMMLFLCNSTVHLAFRLGRSTLNERQTTALVKVTLDEWHTVSFSQSGMEINLNVDGESIRDSLSSSLPLDMFDGIFKTVSHQASFLDTQPEVFLGGVPHGFMVPRGIEDHFRNGRYKGCIRKVNIGGIKYNLDSLDGPRGVMRGQGISDCDETACGSEVCKNQGECFPEPIRQSFVCSCPSNYTGNRCQTPMSCLEHQCSPESECVPLSSHVSSLFLANIPQSKNLNYACSCPVGRNGQFCEKSDVLTSVQMDGESYGLVQHGPFLSTHDSARDLFAFNFSTLAQNGLILWKGDVSRGGEDYMGVGIWREKLKVVWHLGGDNVESIIMSNPVIDGKWHSLVVTRQKRLISVFLDGKSFKKSNLGDYSQLNAPHSVYVGGLPKHVPLTYATDLHFASAYVGCIADLLLHPGASYVVFSQLREGRSLNKCHDAPDK